MTEILQIERNTGIRYDLLQSLIEANLVEAKYIGDKTYIRENDLADLLNDLISKRIARDLDLDCWYVSEYAQEYEQWYSKNRK